MQGFSARAACALLLVLPVSLLCADLPERPATPKRPVVDEYHGVKVVDPYRWLEAGQEAEVKKWVTDQNRYTRAYIDQFKTRRDAILRRLDALSSPSTNPYENMVYADGLFYALSGELLVTLRDEDDPDSERTLVDATKVAKDPNAIIDFFSLSPDGKRVAVSISAEGREDGTVYVFNTRNGRKLPDVIPNVNSPLGGHLLWDADGTGFYYTRNPTSRDNKKLVVPQQIYHHILGKPVAEDTYVFGKDLSPISDITFDISPDGDYLLATVTVGWASDQTTHYLKGPKGDWKVFAAGDKKVLQVVFGPDDDLYLLSNLDAPRGQILRLPLKDAELTKAKILIPQSESVIQSFMFTEERLLVFDYREGSTEIRSFDFDGGKAKKLPIPQGVHVRETVPLEGDDFLLLIQTWLKPNAWFRYEEENGKLHPTQLVSKYDAVNFDDTEVVREYATSKDGTKVPLTILRRKGTKLDGANPVLLHGYGGYRLILHPEFDPSRRLWIEQGGVYAIAHLRGDGDYGDDWHRAGILANRQNAFDDFAACAKHLIERKYTTSERLAIEGASNGGTLMGAVLTQHPNLFRAVVSHVGVYDMLRQEDRITGGFDIAEFGTVKDAAQFKAMYSYSPYHRVKDGTPYPAVFLMTGENDGRVDPADSRKLAAKLQAATSSKNPILLWTSAGAGHQFGLDELEIRSDVYTFLFDQLKMEYQAKNGKKTK